MSLQITAATSFQLCCPKCNKIWKSTPFRLSLHMRSCKTLKCNECNKYFTSNSVLTIHQRHHSGEKPFICPLSDKSFASKSNLKSHQAVHSDVKFHCRQCDKCFLSMERLSMHEKINSGEKPFD